MPFEARKGETTTETTRFHRNSSKSWAAPGYVARQGGARWLCLMLKVQAGSWCQVLMQQHWIALVQGGCKGMNWHHPSLIMYIDRIRYCMFCREMHHRCEPWNDVLSRLGPIQPKLRRLLHHTSSLPRSLGQCHSAVHGHLIRRTTAYPQRHGCIPRMEKDTIRGSRRREWRLLWI